MKIEPPLANLINRCQTICVAECCGIDAYDFSPIQIASYLTMWQGLPDENEVKTILNQLAALKKRVGSDGVTVTMNQIFTKNQFDELVEEITTNIDVALDLIKQSEARRMRHALP